MVMAVLQVLVVLLKLVEFSKEAEDFELPSPRQIQFFEEKKSAHSGRAIQLTQV